MLQKILKNLTINLFIIALPYMLLQTNMADAMKRSSNSLELLNRQGKKKKKENNKKIEPPKTHFGNININELLSNIEANKHKTLIKQSNAIPTLVAADTSDQEKSNYTEQGTKTPSPWSHSDQERTSNEEETDSEDLLYEEEENSESTQIILPAKVIVQIPCESKAINDKNIKKFYTEERPYACSAQGCTKSYKRLSHLRTHVLSHEAVKPYACEICNSTFTQQSHLTVHMRTHTGETPYQCSFDGCSRAFVQQGLLTAHMRTHTGEKPHTCPYDNCTKSFAERSKLNRHIQTHTPDRPYSCEVCNKKFSINTNLIIHMRTHSGDRPHSCTICNSSFTQKGNLNRHMYTKHPDEG